MSGRYDDIYALAKGEETVIVVDVDETPRGLQQKIVAALASRAKRDPEFIARKFRTVCRPLYIGVKRTA